ncbi:superoxide dismutase [Patescibacteria group bacterium]|nr:superoxide dismutase [Patescibacteria group bacterium]
MAFELPKLSYEYNALEPYIDAQTMEIHHTKHHQTYITNLNNALQQIPEVSMTLEEMLLNIGQIPEQVRTAIKNNAGGHHNHSLFWDSMTPGGASAPVGDLETKMGSTFGSFSEFKELLSKEAMSRFGSGWAWLSVEKSTNSLRLHSTPNQDSPLMEGLFPILGLDVWEHAYYLKYQNKRVDYVQNWFNLVNWDIVLNNYKKVMETTV